MRELSSRGIPTAIVDEILNLDPRIFNPKNLWGFLHLEGFKSSDQTSNLSIAKSGDRHSIRDYKSLKNIKAQLQSSFGWIGIAIVGKGWAYL
jgi:hypothetical protein